MPYKTDYTRSLRRAHAAEEEIIRRNPRREASLMDMVNRMGSQVLHLKRQVLLEKRMARVHYIWGQMPEAKMAWEVDE